MFHHHLVKSASWLLTSIGGLAWGLIALGGYLDKSLNIWDLGFLASNPQLVMILQLLIGVAGALSLVSWFMCMGHCDSKKH